MTLQQFFQQASPPRALRLIGPLLKTSPCLDLPVLYIDGGLEFKPNKEHLHFSIGDGDSSRHSPQLLLSPRKDFSDLQFALEQIPECFKTLYLDGFLGGRKDHEWINLAVLHRFLKLRPQTKVNMDEDVVTCVGQGQWTFEFLGPFSLLCLEETSLKLEGSVKYPYDDSKKFPGLSSLGLSNFSSGSFQLNCEGPAFVIRSDLALQP